MACCETFSPEIKSHNVIALIDMDSFECQIYKRMYPSMHFWGQPWVVVDQTGRIVSATQEARVLGISREIRLREAQKIARRKNIHLEVFTKPNDREKPDGKEVRYATWEILDSLKEYASKYSYGVVIEYSSCDEFYLDITQEVNLRLNDSDFPTLVESRTFLETEKEKINGDALRELFRNRYWNPVNTNERIEEEKRLLCGGLIMQEINNFLFGQTKFIASVGVGSNKLMAKLGVSINKPNGITILPDSALSRVGNCIAVEKIPGFGGVFGTTVKETLKVSSMNDLKQFKLDDLNNIFGAEKGPEIYFKSRGMYNEPVKEKLMTDEVSSGKTFFGQITSDETLQYHMHQLTEELLDRLEEELSRHKRVPTLIRFLLKYSPKNGIVDQKEEAWSFLSVYENTKSCTQFCKEAISAVFADTNIEIEEIKITRLEVRAKGFVSLNY